MLGYGCAFLYGFTYDNQGVFLRRFRDSGAVVSGSVSSPLDPLSPSSSPFLLLGSAWVSFLFFFAPACRTTVVYAGRSGLHMACLSPFLLFSLPGPAPLSLALSLSLSLSLFFSLSLSLFFLHARVDLPSECSL